MDEEKCTDGSGMYISNVRGFISIEDEFLAIAYESCIESLEHHRKALTSIIFSCIYLEGFINTLNECIPLHLRHLDINDDMKLLHEILDTLENARESLQTRYLMIPLILSRIQPNKSHQPYLDFINLIKLRNDLMHLRPNIMGNEHPPYIKCLINRKIIPKPNTEGVPGPWEDLCKSPHVAKWAFTTALNMTDYITSLLPNNFVKHHFENRVKNNNQYREIIEKTFKEHFSNQETAD